MANNKPAIHYTARDFSKIKRELIDYAKKYYPDTYKDFSEAGFGSLMLDMVAYVGDVLSYATDFAANESFLDTALEYDNVLKHGKSKGYKFRGNPSSFGIVDLYLIVPASSYGLGPDTRYLPMMLKGSEFANSSGNGFILNENVDFSKSSNEVIVAQVSSTTGVPVSYAIKASGQVISGELVRQTVELGDFEQFLRVELSMDNLAEVVSVVDSEGHEYFEVDYLSQDTVFKAMPNFGNDRDTVSNILKPITVPRRFVVETERNKAYIQFGYGSSEEIKINPVAEPAGLVLQRHGKDYVTDLTFDPSKMLQTDKFGVAPSNTILTITARVNSSDNVNAAVGSINSVVSPIFEFKDSASLSTETKNSVIGSIEVSNDSPIVGDVSVPSTTEIKRRIFDAYASQNRAVTKQDYLSCIYQMPPKYGAVKRASIAQDSDSFKRNLNLYVVSENTDGTLVVANGTIKANIKTWLESVKMINDTIDILDPVIVNLGIKFEAVVDEEQNRYSALSQATSILRDYYKTAPDIGENFNISNIYTLLKMIPSIVDVTDVEIVNHYGGTYSDASFDVNSYTSADGRMIYCPVGFVFEIRYPSSDIVGSLR